MAKRKTEDTEEVTLYPEMARIENLETCLAKMAHYSGTNRILDEFNIPRWEPGQKDMHKYKE